MKINAAVTRAKGAAFRIEELELEDPRPDEIIVRMVATGICHSDLVARDQEVPVPLPIVLGHEGAGIVERVGSSVTKLKPGDPVILSRLTCGTCTACMEGRGNYCEHTAELNIGGYRADGSTALSKDGCPIAGHLGGQSSFASYAIANERNATKVDADLDLTIAPAFACGALTGAGTVLNGLKPRVGSSIVIFGVGAVGMTALMAAKAVGCTTLIAIDRHPDRLELARELGATHTIVADGKPLVPALHEIVPGGVEFSVDTTSVPAVVKAAVDCLRRGGQCALLGIGPVEQEVSLTHLQIVLGGVGVHGFPTGNSEPDVLIPRLVSLYKQGRFPVDRLISRFSFENIEDAVRATEDGSAIKPVLTFD